VEDSLIGTFPDGGGVQALPPGRTVFNVKTGEVLVGGQSRTIFRIGPTLKELGRDRFRSAFIFYDQPAEIKIDNRPSFPLQMGMNGLHVSIKETIEIDSFMPAACAVVLSTGDTTPIEPLTRSFDFWRFGELAQTTNNYQVVRLRPKSLNFRHNPSALGIATRKLLDSSLIENDDQGMPVVANLTKMTIMVENEDAANTANVRVRMNAGEGETKATHPITGDNGVPIGPRDFAVFNIDAETYYRLRIDAKSHVTGSHVGGIKVSLKGIWGG